MEQLELVASAITKHLGIDMGEKAKSELLLLLQQGVDMKTLYSSILKSSGKCSPDKDSHEVMQWISFAEGFRVDALSHLNHHLADNSVLLGNGFTLSDADVIVFSVVHSSVIGLSSPEREKLTHVLRWMDYIQQREDFGELFQKILVEKPDFNFKALLQRLNDLAKSETDSSSKNTMQSMKDTDRSKEDSDVKKNDAKGKSAGSQDYSQEKKKQPEAEVVEKDKELSVSLLNIRVGLIRKAWKHPSADSLLVEEIDVGDAKLRQVISGLAKYYSPDELTNRHVVLITNVKPGKLRDVMSEGLVLCASNLDHTVVEPLLPPQGAKIGERISFSGIDGKPEDVLNPKKKQLEKITPNLFTDDKGVATFKGIPFMTSGGPCTSSLTKAIIK